VGLGVIWNWLGSGLYLFCTRGSILGCGLVCGYDLVGLFWFEAVSSVCGFKCVEAIDYMPTKYPCEHIAHIAHTAHFREYGCLGIGGYGI